MIHRHDRSRRLRAWRAVLVIAVLLSIAAPASGQASDDDPDDQSDRDLVRLVDQTTWVDPDGEIVVRFQIDPTADDPATRGATVTVVIHELLRDRTDFERTLTRERLGGRLTEIDLGTVDELDPNGTGATITARVPIRSGPPVPGEPARLGMANAGVYPVDISIVADGGSRIGGLLTHIVRLPIDSVDPPLGVVLVQPLPGNPSHLPDGTISIDTATRTNWALAVAALDGGTDSPVVVAPRPETVDALAGDTLAGDAAPLDQVLLDDLSVLLDVHTTPLLAYVDIDIDGMTRAGMPDEIDLQLERGSATLLDRLGARPDSTLWVADETLTTTALDALVERGVTHVLVPHEALATDDTDLPTPTPFWLAATDSVGVRALATDPLLQSHQGSTGDSLLDAQHLLADLAVVWFDEPTEVRATVVMLDSEAPDLAFLDALRLGLDDSPLLAASTPGDALAEVDPASDDARTLSTSAGTANLGPLRRDLDLARLSIASFSSVFPEGTDQLDRFDDLISITPSSALTQAERSPYFQSIATEMELTLATIGVPERRAITLPARDGTIPLTLTNSSGQPAVVSVLLDSDKLEFPDGDRVEVALGPGPTSIEVAVRARASGAFPLEITVESPDSRIELGTARYTVRSTAVSGVGIVLSIAAILVLGLWWFRTARGARASHHDEPVTADR